MEFAGVFIQKSHTKFPSLDGQFAMSTVQAVMVCDHEPLNNIHLYVINQFIVSQWYDMMMIIVII